MFKVLSISALCRITVSLLAAAFALSSAPAMAAGDPAAGETKIATCAGCHGSDGKALLPENPNLAGQHASYLVKQLKEYQSGERVNAIMAGMSATLSEQDIEDISAYYASQAPVAGVADEENLELGQSIYRGGITAAGIPSCSGCHGATGNGNPAAVWPALAGQNAAYVKACLLYTSPSPRD